jgi:hypothetical protein
MESFACEGARNCAIGAHEPKIKTKLFGDRQSESMTASGAQDNFNTLIVGAADCSQIGFGNDKFRIQDGAVDIDGQKPDGRGHHM